MNVFTTLFNKRREDMRYEFRTTDGRVCCSSTTPSHLCSECREKLRSQQSATTVQTVAPHGSINAGVDPPPSLIELVRAAGPKRASVVNVVNASARPNVHGVDAPPDLIASIRALGGVQ
jgi:hypothetical protein